MSPTTILPTTPKIFTIGPITENVCCSLTEDKGLGVTYLTSGLGSVPQRVCPLGQVTPHLSRSCHYSILGTLGMVLPACLEEPL